jgi:hypothetical protein
MLRWVDLLGPTNEFVDNHVKSGLGAKRLDQRLGEALTKTD